MKAFRKYVKRLVREANRGNLESRRALGALALALAFKSES
jgi:hypothetical protein